MARTMNRREILAALSDERERLVADLGTLTPADWDRPSLCEGWTVRDVVGHLLQVDASYKYVIPFFLGIARYGFRPHTYIGRDARKRAAGRSPESLLAALSATRFEQTIGARIHWYAIAPLAELIIHGQDIRRPLGVGHAFAADRLVAVADALAKHVAYPSWRRRRLPTERRLEATDVDWSWGKGEVVRAPLEEIVMRLAGRRLDVA